VMELRLGPNFPELNWGGNRKRTQKRASEQEVTYYVVLTTMHYLEKVWVPGVFC
jgi:hypothetical protein